MENLQPVPGQEIEQTTAVAPQPEHSTLTLSERRTFMKLPLWERRQISARQAEEMLERYENCHQWRELEAGDIIDY